jgi:hypothetical protein
MVIPTRVLLSAVAPFPVGCVLTAVGNPAGDMLLTSVRSSAPGGARVGVWLLTKAGATTLIGETNLPGKDNSGGAVADEFGNVYLVAIEADPPPAPGSSEKAYLYTFPLAIPPFTRAGGVVDALARDTLIKLDARLDRIASGASG